MKIAWVVTMIGLGVAPSAAHGQPVTQPSEVDANRRTVGVEVLAPNAEVDAAELRAAIGADLGGDIIVTDATAFAPGLGRLEIAVDRGLIRIAYHPAPGTVIERQLALPIEPGERVQLIAYVATNLVRDQAGEILAGLEGPRFVVPPPEQPPRGAAKPPTRRVPVTLGFVPPASIDRAFGERVIVGVGLHALVGVTTGSEIASVSGIVDVQRERAGGVQIGGVAAVSSGTTEGAQLGGVLAFTRTRLEGAQLGGVAAVTRGDVEGAQVGGVLATSRGLHGVQIGGVAAVARGDVEGVQIGGVASVARRVEGLQIAGVATVGGDVHGVQIGVVNAARRMRGVQLGVVNLSEDGDDAIPIGLINYARNGRLAAEAWVESSRLSAVAVRHGTRRVHNVWGVAWSPDHDHVLAGVGLGAHVPLDGPTLDLDAMYWLTDPWNAELGQISQLRASVAVPLGGVEVFGGAAANLYVSDDAMDESANFHPVLERRTTTSGGRAVVAWPTAFVGVRLRAR